MNSNHRFLVYKLWYWVGESEKKWFHHWNDFTMVNLQTVKDLSRKADVAGVSPSLERIMNSIFACKQILLTVWARIAFTIIIWNEYVWSSLHLALAFFFLTAISTCLYMINWRRYWESDFTTQFRSFLVSSRSEVFSWLSLSALP